MTGTKRSDRHRHRQRPRLPAPDPSPRRDPAAPTVKPSCRDRGVTLGQSPRCIVLAWRAGTRAGFIGNGPR